MSAPDDEDVVASGQALQVVAGWLGISNPEEALDEEPEDQQGLAAQPRPQGLGLGAKFLPHHKGVLLTAGVQQRLGNKLRQSRLRDQPQAAHAGQGHISGPHSKGHIQQQQQQGGKKGQAAAGAGGAAGGGGSGQRQADGNEGSSDESEGRGAAFGKRQRVQQQGDAQQAGPAQQGRQRQGRPQGFSKADLLSGAGQQSGGKRKGKKRKDVPE